MKSVGGTQDFLGIVVAAFSIGQLLGGPFWGWAADTYSFTSVLYITTALRAIGNLAYGFCAVFPISQDWFMAATRLIVGFAAGSMAVCTSYTSTAYVIFFVPMTRTFYLYTKRTDLLCCTCGLLRCGLTLWIIVISLHVPGLQSRSEALLWVF